jgi:iron complex transport system substrate-binding protein
MRYKKYFLPLSLLFSYFFAIIFFVSCKYKNAENQNNTTTTNTKQDSSKPTFNTEKPLKKLFLGYAKGFEVSYFADYKVVTVLNTNFVDKKNIHYILVPKGKPTPTNLPTESIVVQTPLPSIICLSTTHAPLLSEIGEIDKITGFSGIAYSAILDKYANKEKIAEIGGQNGQANIEKMISLAAGGVMLYDENLFHKLKQLGQKPILNTEYLENSPLGRAEWIKFAAVFFDKEEIAEKFFTQIAQNYEHTKQQVANQGNRKRIFGTIPYNNVWYMPAGESFAATLWQDAGANYLWQYSSGTGSLQLSVEEVVHKAYQADMWLNVGSIGSIKELVAMDSRFSSFQAVKNKQVYNCDKKTTQGGGNEFYEYGVIRPDIVLQDLAKILYPNLFKEKELYFYRRLQ